MFLYRMMVTPHAPKSFKDRTLVIEGWMWKISYRFLYSVSLKTISLACSYICFDKRISQACIKQKK